MILIINTTQNDKIELALKDKEREVARMEIDAPRQQSEKLLPGIEKLLQKNKIKLSDLTGIEVENRGGSFTSLRIGVVTANALGFALGVAVRQPDNKTDRQRGAFSIVKPEYDREPNITAKKMTVNN
jgi:tRNA A37 threonylcarbamoyladenosine modification protein TsaB